MSRTRTERVASTLLGREDNLIRCPRCALATRLGPCANPLINVLTEVGVRPAKKTPSLMEVMYRPVTAREREEADARHPAYLGQGTTGPGYD
jgi:hypothetical protein